MGKQINFYMDYQMECRFVDFVLRTGGQILNEDTNPPVSLESLPEGICMTLCLYKTEFGPLTYIVDGSGSWYFDRIISPVVEFSRSLPRTEPQKEVIRGRLWTELRYWNDKGDLIQKPKELDRWYGSLSRWIRNNLKQKVNFAYSTSSMLELLKQKFRFW